MEKKAIGVSMTDAERYKQKGEKVMKASDASLLEETFVNRNEELKIIDEVLKSVADINLYIKKPIIEFWGISGIGKTFLLMRIMDSCKQQKLNYTFLDFEGRQEQEPIEFIKEITTQLQITNSEEEYMSRLEDQLNQYIIHQTTFETVQAAFVQLVQQLLKKHPLISIFDTMEEVLENNQIMQWFSDTIDKLIDQGKMVVIFTSKRQVTFSERIPINRRLYDYQLKPFNNDDTKFQLDSIKSEKQLAIPIEIFDQVYEISAGHPLLNKYLITIADSKKIQRENFQKFLPELIDSLDTVFDQWILKETDAVSKSKYKALLTTLAIPRQFNLRIMEKLVEEYNSNYALPGSLAYIDLVNELRVKTSLVDWDFYKSAYSVDITMRKILKNRLYFHHPDTFAAINKTMIEIYKGWIKQVTGFDLIKYLLELIYHTAVIAESTESAVSVFADYVNRIFSAPEQYDERNRLKEQLNGDSELIEILGDDNFEKMLNIAKIPAERG